MNTGYELLIECAKGAVQTAYAPYSLLMVGAAVLGASSEIYTGANIENVSYGLTICAERAAIFRAVQSGERRLLALAIEAKKANSEEYLSIVPCGACLQVLAEFIERDAPIFISGSLAGKFSDFFPRPFIF